MLAALFCLTVKAETQWYVQTSNFSRTDFHDVPELNGVTIPGLVIGWSLFGLITFVTGVMTFAATWSRNTEYTKLLEEDVAKMKALGLNVDAINEEFE